MTSRPSPSSPPPDNATTRFGERASAYAAARPSYPAKVIDAVLDGMGDPRGLVGADVGAGTGVFSRLLARRGVRVIAVEPNAPMRDEGRRAPDNAGLRIEWREGAGEATGLDEHSVDLVTVAQAFHWMRTEDALREFHRIMRPGGRLTHVWNVLDRTDPFTAGYCAAMERHAVDPPRSPWSLQDVSGILDDHPLFMARRITRVAHAQALDRDGLRTRAQRASYCPKGGPGWDALRGELDNLFDRFARDGRVSLVYSSEVHASEAR